MTDKQLSPAAQAVLDATRFEVNAEGHSPWIAAAVLRCLIDECSEVRGTGRVDKKSQVVSVKTLMKLIEELK